MVGNYGNPCSEDPEVKCTLHNLWCRYPNCHSGWREHKLEVGHPTDEDGCYTVGDGSCISRNPCIHDLDVDYEPKSLRQAILDLGFAYHQWRRFADEQIRDGRPDPKLAVAHKELERANAAVQKLRTKDT